MNNITISTISSYVLSTIWPTIFPTIHRTIRSFVLFCVSQNVKYGVVLPAILAHIVRIVLYFNTKQLTLVLLEYCQYCHCTLPCSAAAPARLNPLPALQAAQLYRLHLLLVSSNADIVPQITGCALLFKARAAPARAARRGSPDRRRGRAAGRGVAGVVTVVVVGGGGVVVELRQRARTGGTAASRRCRSQSCRGGG